LEQRSNKRRTSSIRNKRLRVTSKMTKSKASQALKISSRVLEYKRVKDNTITNKEENLQNPLVKEKKTI